MLNLIQHLKVVSFINSIERFRVKHGMTKNTVMLNLIQHFKDVSFINSIKRFRVMHGMTKNTVMLNLIQHLSYYGDSDFRQNDPE